MEHVRAVMAGLRNWPLYYMISGQRSKADSRRRAKIAALVALLNFTTSRYEYSVLVYKYS
jgi:hypothetical protein